jgi:site-specific DNA-methyltransferase (adenine-specific)
MSVKSESSDHPTPQWIFDLLNKIFLFDLDVAASRDNAKCPKFFSELDNGLAQKWTGRVWMNPPYGKDIDHWVQKACHSVAYGHAQVVVGLLPNRTSANWYHCYVYRQAIEIPVRGRLRFEGNDSHAMFASIVAIWLPEMSKEAARLRDIDTNDKIYTPEWQLPLLGIKGSQ